MADVDWILGDLIKLRTRFRDARLAFPGLRSALVEMPDMQHVWHVSNWQRVKSFASVRGLEFFSGDPSIDFYFVRPAVVSLWRPPEAGWDSVAAVALFGELAHSTIATLHLHEVFRAIAEVAWPAVSERAWVHLLHRFTGYQIEAALQIEHSGDISVGAFEFVTETRELPMSRIDDIFEASCRLIDDCIKGLENTAASSLTDNLKAPEPIAVCLHPPQVKYRDTIYAVSPDGAVFVQSLANARGDWVAGSKLEMRADRVKSSLPEPIRDLIESVPGKGYRLSRTLWEVA